MARGGRKRGGGDRRDELVRALADHVLSHGLGATSLAQLAQAAGTSDRMLVYYFTDKPGLMAAVLTHLAAQFTVGLDAARLPGPVPEEVLRGHLARLVLAEPARPFLQLWLEIVASAARGDPVTRDVAREIGTGYLDWITPQLDLPPDAARAAAARLLTEIEGLVLLDGIGLGAEARSAAGL